MDEHEWLAEQFEGYRTHLRTVAYRMLGSLCEAEDAVQESWLRLSNSDTSRVENLGGWLTTIVARVCLDMLRSRKVRPVESLDAQGTEPVVIRADTPDPEHETFLADSVGLALLIVLDTLAPEERLAFVLHDLFAVPFAEIGPIVGRSPTAARQLASRARRRVQGASLAGDTDPNVQREIVVAFLTAARTGDFGALLAVLDPDVVLRADSAASEGGFPAEMLGAHAVAHRFNRGPRGPRLALINGIVGAVWTPGGVLHGMFEFAIKDRRIVEIHVSGDPARLSEMDFTILDE